MRISDRKEFKQKGEPLTCRPDTTVFEAVQEMAALNYGSIIVTDGNRKVLGMMTERDIFRRLIAKELNPKTTPVSQIMTTPVRKAREDDNLLDWLRMMSNERFRRLPIVDKDNRLVAVMTQGDFVSYTWPELLGRVGEMAQASLPERINPTFMIGAILLYTLVLIWVVSRL